MNVGQSGKAFGQSAQTAAAQGVYTTAQAERGRQVYDRQCAVCHGGSLSGIDVNPPLAGSRFLSGWKGQSVGALVTRIRATMPPEKPGSLTVSQSVDVAAFILRTNRFPAGTRDLPVTPAGLRSIKIDQPPSVRR
jgi:cytochrome c